MAEEPTIWIAPGRPVAVPLHSPEASDHLCHPFSIFLPAPAPGILHPHRPAHHSSLKMELQPHRRKIPEERATEWESGTSAFLNPVEAGWAPRHERPHREGAGNATGKRLSRGPSGARAAPASALYWRARPRGRSYGKAPPTRGGAGIRRASPPRSAGAGLGLRLGPAAPLGCRSVLQPPARRRVRGRGEERGGRRDAGGGERRRKAAYTRLPVPPRRAARRPLPPPPRSLLPLCHLRRPPGLASPVALGDPFLAPGF